MQQIGQGAARDWDPESTELFGLPVQGDRIGTLACDDEGAKAIAVPSPLYGMIGTRRDHHVLATRTRERLSDMSTAAKVARNVVDDDGFLAAPDGAKLGAVALGTRAVTLRNLVLDGVRLNARSA